MKRTLLFGILMLTFLSTQAQTKSTGVVTLPVSGMTVKLDLNSATSIATLTLTGPFDRWFALQFGSFATGDGMVAGQDVVYYNGTTLIDAVHNGVGIAPSTDTNNWTVTSNTTASSTRTIVATRAFNTGSPSNDYAFVYANTSIDFACAKMGTADYTLAYHGAGNRGYAIDTPLSTVLGVEDFSLNTSVIYPNPSSKGNFKIQSKTPLNKVTIYTLTGALVKTIEIVKNEENVDVNVADLKAGIYLIELQNDTDKSWKKVIVN